MNPMHDPSESPVSESDKNGLTTEAVQDLRAAHGFNEIAAVEVSLTKMFLLQFT